ncbi:hypothetical protein ACFOSD_04815 [Salinispirillum marinum]|uniref:Uncharacterized protein n=2 Tax=Saccharospirillaceae TaxID=255527 RepID=A0ABV8BBE8_9GAMM
MRKYYKEIFIIIALALYLLYGLGVYQNFAALIENLDLSPQSIFSIPRALQGT